MVGDKYVVPLDDLYYVQFMCSTNKGDGIIITLQEKCLITSVGDWGNLCLKGGGLVTSRGLDGRKIVKDGNKWSVTLVGNKEYVTAEYVKVITEWTTECAESWFKDL